MEKVVAGDTTRMYDFIAKAAYTSVLYTVYYIKLYFWFWDRKQMQLRIFLFCFRSQPDDGYIF
jgi:hypothetical protein